MVQRDRKEEEVTTDNDLPELLGRKFERLTDSASELKIGDWLISVYRPTDRKTGPYYAMISLCGSVIVEMGPCNTAQFAADIAWTRIARLVEPITKMVKEARNNGSFTNMSDVICSQRSISSTNNVSG